MKDGRLDFATARRISEADFREWTRKAQPLTHDVVLSRRTNPGVTANVTDQVDFALGQNLVLLRADGRVVLPEFLRWLVTCPAWWEQVRKYNNVGAVFDSLKCADVPRFELPIPPLPVQAAIDEILRTLDDRIELNRRMNETLEAMAQAIFRDWFVDFGPVRRKMEGATAPITIMGGLTPDPARAAELAALFPAEFEGAEPRGFEWTSLGQATNVLETGTRPKGGIKGITSGVPSIGAESITGLAQFDFSKTKFVPADFFASMKRGVLGQRDVLLYKDGGRPGEFEPHVSMFGDGFPFEHCSINEHVYRLVAASPFSQEFLYFHLTSDSSMDEMRNKGTGVAIPGLNSTAAKSIEILQPPAGLLAAFEAIVRPMTDKALLNAKENRTLAETRDYLLPRLMSGAVRVGNAETQDAAA